MARTRVVLGYTGKEPAALVYAGNSGSEAEAAMAGSNAERFEILEGPGRKKNNAHHVPAAPPADAPAAEKPKRRH